MLSSTNLNMIDAKLKNAFAYQADNEWGGTSWFLRLVYTYEDDAGLHEVTFPKVTLPFNQNSIPNFECTFNYERPYISPPMYIDTLDSVLALGGYVLDPLTCKAISNTRMTDIIVKPKTHKMTIEEIEKRLGYKVEIISKKD